MAAWDELVASWSERLHYFLHRLIDHEHDVANVLQEVWLQAFRNIGSLQQGARLAPWLYTIARRSAMNHYRSVYSNQGLNAPPPADESVDPIEPSDDSLNLENAELVHFGLSRLEVPQRELLTLYFLDDLSIAEIATVLEIPPGTVKSRLAAARRELRRILDEEASRHA